MPFPPNHPDRQTEYLSLKIQLRSKYGILLHSGPLLIHYSSYFYHFEGHQDCSVASTDLYSPPRLRDADGRKLFPYCTNRAKLLEAMSGGGRHGFDAPFSPVGCQYRWYSTVEICMILERFDAIVFIGDDMLQHIYGAFNMLLRENIATGSLKQWDMKENERTACRCDDQMIKAECSKYAITDSQAVSINNGGGGRGSPYYCDRQYPLSTQPKSLLQANPCRDPTHVPTHYKLTRSNKSSYHIHFFISSKSRILQANSCHPLAIAGDVPIMARSNSIDGRVGHSSRFVY